LFFIQQFLFEIAMAWRGAFLLPQVALQAEGSSLISAWLTLWVTFIGLSLLLMVLPFLRWIAKRILFLCICMFIIGVLAMDWMKSISLPVGMDNPETVRNLASQLISSEKLPYSLAQRFDRPGAIFISAPISPAGHSHVSLNRIGCASISASEAAKNLSKNLESLFPIVARGQRGREVFHGNQFMLGILPITGWNPVTSSGLRNNYFTLTTEPAHWLQGTAKHGIVEDSTGSLWLFQVGEGVSGEAGWKQLLNHALAKEMWHQMGQNVSAHLKLQCGSGNLQQFNVPTSTLPIGQGASPPVNTEKDVVWTFDNGLDNWKAADAILAGVSGKAWLQPIGSEVRALSPSLENNVKASVLEVDLAANCLGPAKVYWAAKGQEFQSDRLLEFATQGCDRCGSAGFNRYRAAFPAGTMLQRLAIAPCGGAIAQEESGRIGLDFVRILLH
jgi:hypothetical protein